MTPAQIAKILALVDEYLYAPLKQRRAAIEAALRDAPQAEPTDPEDCHAWCPRCDGTGDEVQMSDSSPDAHEVTVNCRHCDGAGTLYAAYNGVVRELAKKHQAYIKACGEIYFSKLKNPSAPTALEPDERAPHQDDPELTPAAFADRLARHMQIASLTAKEVSELTGVSETTLSRLKNHGRMPDAISYAALCNFMGWHPHIKHRLAARASKGTPK
jgi:predicted DNA-binding transcriptional regulator AlpA